MTVEHVHDHELERDRCPRVRDRDILTTGARTCADFTITGDTCAGAMLAPAASCTIDVAFAPSVRGTRSATVNATASPGGTNTMAVQGIGLAPAHLVASPAVHDFGGVVVNGASAPLTITVTNDGDAPTGAIGDIVLGGAQSELAIVSNGCTTTSLAGGQSCEVVARFTPTLVGSYSGTLSVASSIGGTAAVALAGTGIAPASLSIAPAVVDFGARIIGSSSPTSLLTVTNTGGVPTAALATAISGANPGDFTVGANSCAGTTLAPGVTCTIAIAFDPSSAGMRTATLGVTGAGVASASLLGTGITPAQIVATPPVLAFGTVLVDASAAFSVTVTNLGGATSGALDTSLVNANSPHFSLGSDTCAGATLAAGASCTLVVTFAPTTVGAASVDVRIVAAPGGTVLVAASGTSVAPAHLQISPSIADFGSVVVGQASSPITFTVQNTGDVPTGSVTPSLLAPDASQFSIEPASTCSSSALLPDTSCTLVVQFRPTSTGAKSSAANASASPGGAASANLAGTGLAPAQLQMSPALHDFGSVVVGEQSGAVLFTVTNAGGVTSGVVDGVFLAPDGSQFIIDLGLTTCGVTLAPGASCITAVRFAPTSTGMKTSTGRVSATPGGSVDAALAGTGIGSAALAMSPPIADFGSVAVGGTSAPVVFTVTNIGGSASGSLMGALADPTDFTVDIGASTCLFATLAPTASCTVTIRFTPTSTGAKSTTASLTGSPGGTVAAPLSGTGI